MNMASSSSSTNNIQSWYNMDELKSKNIKCMKCGKRVAVRISEAKASKHKLFYRCNNKSCENKIINWCEHMNQIDSSTRGEINVNNANDVH